MIEYSWAIEIISVLLFLVLLNAGFKRLLAAIKKHRDLKEGDWLAHIDAAAMAPLRALLWIVLLSFSIDVAAREMGFAFSVSQMRNAAIILSLAWFLLRWKKVVHAAVIRHRKSSYDPLSMQMVGRLFTITVVFVSTLLLLQLFGLDIAPLMTFGGIGAAALGFASKDVIANFFGGVMLSMTRPFTVGDLIELPAKQIVGHIEEIGWYLTSVRTLQKKPIYVPNWLFATEVVINESRMTHRRIEETVGIRYADAAKVLEILAGIRAFLDRNTSVDHQEPLYLFLQNFSPWTVDLEIKVYVHCTHYGEFMQVRQDILLGIYEVITSLGAEMPVPTSRVLIDGS